MVHEKTIEGMKTFTKDVVEDYAKIGRWGKLKPISLDHKNSFVSSEELSKIEKKLQEEISNMQKASKLKYEDERCSINLPDDTESIKLVKDLVKQKKELNPYYLVVVGIGGSNLGTKTVHQLVSGKLFNQLRPTMKVIYADTVDSDLMDQVTSILERALERGDNILINVVSKSGTTTETIANFEILISLLKKYRKDYEKYVVVTTDKDSKLWKFGKEKGFSIVEVPRNVGGRYSVFSSVGLFPLGMLDIDIDELVKGASYSKKECLNNKIYENPAALSAAILYYHYKKGKNIHDTFLFGNDLESIGNWYRQLMAESIGKDHDKSGEKVNIGITPTVSIGSTDLHSMAQLYLGGPFDKVTTFVTVTENRDNVKLPDSRDFEYLVPNLQKRSLKQIMDAIYDGAKIAYTKAKRPYMEIVLPDKSEFTAGQLLQFKMMEMMYLAYLLNVNPFDQPNVESYKDETKKILQKLK